MGKKKETPMDEKLYFKIHVPNLLKEIMVNHGMGILNIPMNTLRVYLCKVAERASQLNDPELNLLMCEMALYEISDPESKEYDPTIFSKLKKQIKP